MTDFNQVDEKVKAFLGSFWNEGGKPVEQKPQNPIAARQALYNADQRSDKVSLAQGMVFNDQDRLRVYHKESNTWFDSVESAEKQGYATDSCMVFCNRKGKIFHSPAVYVAQQRALERFRDLQFGEDLSKNPAAYGTPVAPALLEAIRFDGEGIYGTGAYDPDQTISFQTVGMASGYKHLTLPVLNSVRRSMGLPEFDTIFLGTNFYGAYPATFSRYKIVYYRYMDENGAFDLESFKKAAATADPRTSLFLFDMSTGNNFVGVRRTRRDNENIAQVLIDRKLYSEHDIAYPNFDPDFNLDDELYRILRRFGVPHGVQSSRGKKDKYAGRLSFHHLYLGTSRQRSEIFSHLVTENRSTFLAMPDTWLYLTEIARDPSLRQAHEKDCQAFVEIVRGSRIRLAKALGWNWMLERSGMFDMVKITHAGADKMGEEHGIYVVPTRNQNRIGKDGLPVEVIRIKHGLSDEAIVRVAAAFQETIQQYPSEAGRPNPDIIIAG